MNKEKAVKNQHKRASKVIFILGIIIAAVLILALVTSIILLFFPVSEIEVVGDSRYNYSDIIESSEIENGDRLYFLDKEEAQEKILNSHPYLKSVTINSYFPNRVKIEIEEFEDIYLVPHTDGYCYVNSNFEILEIISEAPEYERFSGIFIKLEKCAEGNIGDIYESEDTKRASDLIEIIRKYGFYGDLNIVDVRNKYDNAFVVANKYKFVVGAMTDISDKMDIAFKACISDSFKRENNAIIHATDNKKVVLRYVSDENIRQEFDFCNK